MGARVEALGGFRVAVAGKALPEDAWGRPKARQVLKCRLIEGATVRATPGRGVAVAGATSMTAPRPAG